MCGFIGLALPPEKKSGFVSIMTEPVRFIGRQAIKVIYKKR